MRDLQTILADTSAAMGALIEEAFRAGKAEGRREAAAELRGKVAAALGGDFAANCSQSDEPARPMATPMARPGTVKPAVLQMIRDSPGGITTHEINERTAFKPNTIRGTLWGLQKEGLITKNGNRWVENLNQNAEPEQPVAGSDNSQRNQGDDVDKEIEALLG